MRIKGLDEQMIKQYIAEAVLILMEDHPYDKITIGEIAKKAGVNRSSYYRHFDTKEDIIWFYLMSIMDEYMREYRKLSEKTYRLYLNEIFSVFYKHRHDLLLIHKNKLSYLLLDVLNTCFRFDEFSDEKQFEIAYHIGGIYNNLLLWMNHDMKETPEQMTKMALSFKSGDSFTLLDIKGMFS